MRKILGLFFLALFARPLHAQVILVGGATVAAVPSYSCGSLTAFGNQVINVSSAQFSALCTNTGNAFAQITADTITGAGAAAFAFGPGDTCHSLPNLSPVAPSNTCVVAIIFTPTSLIPYSANVNVTASGVTGSPQVLGVSGTGVNAGSNAPNGFTAPTNAAGAIGFTGFTPCNSSGCPGLPAEGGTIGVDTNFVHTNSGGISGSNFTAFTQCAGTLATTNARAIFGGVTIPTNTSWLAPAGGQENNITPDLHYLYLHTRGQGVVFTFNPSTGVCTPAQVFDATSGYAITPGHGILEASLTVGPDTDAFYGYGPSFPSFAKVDFSGGAPGVITNLTGNLNLIPNFCGGITIQQANGGGVGNSGDSIALGKDNILATGFGTSAEVEGNWSCAVFLQQSSAGGGKFGAISWWNTKQDSMDSTHSCYLTTCTQYADWTGGWPSCSANCTGLGGPSGAQGIHAITMDRSGQHANLSAPRTNPSGPTVLLMGTTTATQVTPLNGNGHFANIGPYLCSLSSGLSAKVLCVTFASPGVLAYSATRFPNIIMDQHNGGNGVSASGANGTFSTLGYCNNPPSGGCNGAQPAIPGALEVMQVTPPPTTLGGTYTPIWYRFIHSEHDAVCGGLQSNFWSETTGNTDVLTRWAFIPTNWGCSLGNDDAGFPRQVIIAVELR